VTNQPWTRAELKAMLPSIEARIAEYQAERPNARPLPPMSVEECQDMFCALLDIATTRPLTEDECFLHGQIEAVYRMAVRAEALGYEGRYFVISEQDILDRRDKSSPG
jgi:hypothetical protein